MILQTLPATRARASTAARAVVGVVALLVFSLALSFGLLAVFGGTVGCSAAGDGPTDLAAAGGVGIAGTLGCGALTLITGGLGAPLSVACASADSAVVAQLDKAAAEADAATSGPTTSPDAGTALGPGASSARARAVHTVEPTPAAGALPLAVRLAALCPGAKQHTAQGVPVAAWTCAGSAPPGHFWRVQARLDALSLAADAGTLDAGATR